MARQTAERMATVKENLSIKDGRKNGGEERSRIVVAIDINLLQQADRTT